MYIWVLVIILAMACSGIIISSIATRRVQQQREKERQYRHAKMIAEKTESIIDKFLRIECRQDILDVLIKYHGSQTEKMQSLFPNLDEATTFVEATENLRSLPILSLSEYPIRETAEYSKIQQQVQQFNDTLNHFRANSLVSASMGEQWTRFLKDQLVKAEIQVLIGESERLLEGNDRINASNCLRTAEMRLERLSVSKEEKSVWRKDITSRIKNMYGMNSQNSNLNNIIPPPEEAEKE